MFLSQILKDKGDMVFTIGPEESIASAAALLNTRRVGAMIVLERAKVVGIFSERDIVRLVADEGAACLERPVSDGMSREVIYADPGETVDALLARMTDRRVRHLPVCDKDERLVGIVSIGDLVKSKIAEAVAEAEGLRAYISAA